MCLITNETGGIGYSKHIYFVSYAGETAAAGSFFRSKNTITFLMLGCVAGSNHLSCFGYVDVVRQFCCNRVSMAYL